MTTGDHNSARGKRNIKCLAYIVAGVIAQTIIAVLFVQLVMRVQNPKVCLGSVSVEDLKTNNSSTLPSFGVKLNAQVTVKNTNFGHFKFGNSTAKFSYRGTPIGDASIIKACARSRSTKKFNVTVSLNSNKVSTNSHLAGDINSGKLTLNSYAKLDGKIQLFKVIQKKKIAEMNCTMDVNTKTEVIENLMCK